MPLFLTTVWPGTAVLSFHLCFCSSHIFLSSFFSTLLFCNIFLSFASPLSLPIQLSFTPPVDRLVYILATGELSAGLWHCNTHCPSMTMLGRLTERPWRVKNLHHSSLWITVHLLLTGVYSSCWYSGRIFSFKHVLTGAGDIAKALREDWQLGTWFSMQHS